VCSSDLILTVLGFVLAVLAFVGWKSIQTIAENSAREVVREAISDGGKLETLLKKEVQSQLRYQGVEEVDTDFDEGNGAGNEDGA
jgi:lipopolysaccharide export LptBFGC system permease protein LptF